MNPFAHFEDQFGHLKLSDNDAALHVFLAGWNSAMMEMIQRVNKMPFSDDTRASFAIYFQSQMVNVDAIEKPAQQQELCPSCRNGSIYACTCTSKPAQQQEPPAGCVVVSRAVLKTLGIDDAVIDTIARPAPQTAQQTIHCKHRRENNGVCPHHNLHCGWPKCNEPEQPAQQQEPWPEEPAGHIAVGVRPSTRQDLWVERWYGSLADKGWWIVCGRDHIAHLGTGVSSDEVRKIVDAHNRTSPPTLSLAQRQSHSDVKPLTDERIKAIYAEQTGFDLDSSPEALMDFARAIEAAHGIK